jgi:hypothetical protein
MTCKELERYSRGEMNEAEFQRHASRCPACREAFLLDKEVMCLAQSSRRPIDAPGLWGRIESGLQKEMAEDQHDRKGSLIAWRPLRFVPAALVILLVLGLGIYLSIQDQTLSSGLLARKALAKVEQKEQEYMDAVRELEKQALPRMADMDLELEFLYRDRLETIDAQIAKCREALSTNPANAHIRRYLMAALQDKKDTLAEVLNVAGEKSESRRST